MKLKANYLINGDTSLIAPPDLPSHLMCANPCLLPGGSYAMCLIGHWSESSTKGSWVDTTSFHRDLKFSSRGYLLCLALWCIPSWDSGVREQVGRSRSVKIYSITRIASIGSLYSLLPFLLRTFEGNTSQWSLSANSVKGTFTSIFPSSVRISISNRSTVMAAVVWISQRAKPRPGQILSPTLHGMKASLSLELTNLAIPGFKVGCCVLIVASGDNIAPLRPTPSMSWISEESVGLKFVDRILPILRVRKRLIPMSGTCRDYNQALLGKSPFIDADVFLVAGKHCLYFDPEAEQP